MKGFIFMIGFYSIFNFILVKSISGQNCYLDSINENKIVYTPSGRVDLIINKGIVIPSFDSVTFYKKLNYNQDSLLESVADFIVTFSGDTVSPPWITRTYEYEDGLLSRIWKYSSVIVDDFVWVNNQLIEYKYYYFSSDSTIDSSLTRISQLSYLNNNIHHYFYKEIESGHIFSEYYFYYDNLINPYYESELALVDVNLLKYSSFNNWISTSSGMHRTITYNSQGYPLYIYTDYNNGNVGYDTLTYDCTNSNFEPPRLNENNLVFIPNPVKDYFIIKTNINRKINEVNIFNLNGSLVLKVSNSEIINVEKLHQGIYIVECRFGDIILRKKIIVYTS